MTTKRRGLGLATILCSLVLALACTPAWAQKGAGGGGGGGGGGAVGGGGGGGGGGGAVGGNSGVKTGTITLTGSSAFPGATGTATVTFNSAQTSRSLNVQLENLNLPDGTFLEVDFLDDGETTTVGVYYTFATDFVPQSAGIITTRSGTASLVLPTGNPDVPMFGKNGGVMVSAVDSFGNVITVLSGTYTNLGSTTSQP